VGDAFPMPVKLGVGSLPKHSLNPPRKRRTREHILADLSTNHVEKWALQCGFAVDRLRKDYGLDLAVFTFDAQGFLESGVIWIQIKATDHLKKAANGGAVVVRLDRRDVLAWIGEAYPVILVLYDANEDRGFWISIHSHFGDASAFARLRGKTVSISVPTVNVVTAEAFRAFADMKAVILAAGDERQ
jgi:hypothetical protein